MTPTRRPEAARRWAVGDEEHREAVRQAESVVRWADERIDRLLGKTRHDERT